MFFRQSLITYFKKRTKKPKNKTLNKKIKDRHVCKVILTFLVMEFSFGLMKDEAEIISELKGIFRNYEIQAPDFFEEMLTLQNIPEE